MKNVFNTTKIYFTLKTVLINLISDLLSLYDLLSIVIIFILNKSKIKLE
jgi:hypothetical protein